MPPRMRTLSVVVPTCNMAAHLEPRWQARAEVAWLDAVDALLMLPRHLTVVAAFGCGVVRGRWHHFARRFLRAPAQTACGR